MIVAHVNHCILAKHSQIKKDNECIFSVFLNTFKTNDDESNTEKNYFANFNYKMIRNVKNMTVVGL